jgi:hypothetical protein
VTCVDLTWNDPVTDSDYRFTFVDTRAYGKDCNLNILKKKLIPEINRERFIKYFQFESFK